MRCNKVKDQQKNQVGLQENEEEIGSLYNHDEIGVKATDVLPLALCAFLLHSFF